MKQIEIKTALGCIAAFDTKMKKLGITTPAKGLTTSVGFKSKELIEWLHSVEKNMSELRIVFGEYTAELSPSKEGRFTVLLWPYDENGQPATDENGDEILPVNLGETEP